MNKGRLTIGLSGYSYKPWQGEGRFYPAELKASQFLSYYFDHFNGVEMDSTWYRMPSEENLKKWVDRTPEGFQFTFKAHRKISHISRLKEDCFDSVDFLSKRLKPVAAAGKLGCVFVQLPPNFKKNIDRLASFAKVLDPDLPWGIEFRNPTWNDDEVATVLQERRIAYVSWDTDDADGVRRDSGVVAYARMRRDAYTDAVLQDWAQWFQSILTSGKSSLVFFKHEDEGSPWLDAKRLQALMENPAGN